MASSRPSVKSSGQGWHHPPLAWLPQGGDRGTEFDADAPDSARWWHEAMRSQQHSAATSVLGQPHGWAIEDDDLGLNWLDDSGLVVVDLAPVSKGPPMQQWYDGSAYILFSSPLDRRAADAVFRDSRDEDVDWYEGSGSYLLSSLVAALSLRDQFKADYDPRAALDQIRFRSLRTQRQKSRAEEALDRRLRAALEQAEFAEQSDSQSDWASEVGAVVYAYGRSAVDLLRQYWRDGLLRGEALSEALHELGYLDESSSYVDRRSLLVDSLSDLDANVRYAAAQGLVYLADPAVVGELERVRSTERNTMVQLQLDDAIRASTMV